MLKFHFPEMPTAEICEASDWLIDPLPFKARCEVSEDKKFIKITNGLITRMFNISDIFITLEYWNDMRRETLIRALKPEIELMINGETWMVGGAKGQIEHAYFSYDILKDLSPLPNTFQFTSFRIEDIKKRIEWKQRRYSSSTNYPPKGKEICFEFKHPNLEIFLELFYEIYDGIPLLSKRFRLVNNTKETVRLNKFTSEILAIVESSSVPQGDPSKEASEHMFHIESDYIFSAMSAAVGNVTSKFTVDPDYTSQVAYLNDSKVLFRSEPPIGPELDILQGEAFESFTTYELIFDSYDKERRSLAQRKMYRTICPWVTENPIFMHCITADPEVVKKVIDQCSEVGFEMVILSFGCGISMEWEDDEFYEEYKQLFDYAHEKGIEIGTYSLFSSRSIDPNTDVIMPPKELNIQERPMFGKAPCLQSEWGIDYLRKLRQFLEKTGADFIEHDGPYPGDVCASKQHKGHRDVFDSQWKQWDAQRAFYKYCCEHGIYVNQPDWYFLSGGNKTGMGYKEVNWSLPRDRQIILARQNIYDGTWEKTPSMGWMFTPLTVYHRVGEWEKSTLEPLSEHLKEFEAHLSQNFLSGVQSCYRGTRLYDSDEVKNVIIKWVSFYKQHRAILDSDIIHIRRPDGRHLDAILHVNPDLEECALLAVFNPTSEILTEFIKIPLYYAGIKEKVLILDEDGHSEEKQIDRSSSVVIKIEVPPYSRRHLIFKKGL